MAYPLPGISSYVLVWGVRGSGGEALWANFMGKLDLKRVPSRANGMVEMHSLTQAFSNPSALLFILQDIQ